MNTCCCMIYHGEAKLLNLRYQFTLTQYRIQCNVAINMPTLLSSKTGLSKEEQTHIHVGANKEQ